MAAHSDLLDGQAELEEAVVPLEHLHQPVLELIPDAVELHDVGRLLGQPELVELEEDVAVRPVEVVHVRTLDDRVVHVRLELALDEQVVQQAGQVDAHDGERVAVLRVQRVREDVARHLGVLGGEEDQVLQPQHAHATEVGARVLSLEAHLGPLLRHRAAQVLVGSQQLPQPQQLAQVLGVLRHELDLAQQLHLVHELPVAAHLQHAGPEGAHELAVHLRVDLLDVGDADDGVIDRVHAQLLGEAAFVGELH
ncbi:hypothetical protein MRX96_011389 [Rhipicephalus microplus]